MPTSSSSQRQAQLIQFVDSCLPSIYQTDSDAIELSPLPGDAGFRRYFRVNTTPPLLAVDAPPEHEDCPGFVRVDLLLRILGVHAPEVIAVDYQHGFMLIEYLGSEHYQQSLNCDNQVNLYQAALDTLRKIQRCPEKPNWLPAYDQPELRRELSLFPEWFVSRLLGIDLSDAVNQLLERLFVRLEQSALEQPQVLVHRDYHVRNLMVAPEPPGVIDFQDATWGAVTYDLVSLLRDCYVRWPSEQLERVLQNYQQQLQFDGVLSAPDLDNFRRWFDWMGLQRHIKVLGIFARLAIRDGKQGYLENLPLVMRYTIEVLSSYSELREFREWFETEIVPRAQTQPWCSDWETAGDADEALFGK